MSSTRPAPPHVLALLGVNPTFAKGLIPALTQAGFAAEQPADIDDWLAAQDGTPLVVAATKPAEVSVTGLRAVRPDALIVALLSLPSHQDFANALSEGAAGVASIDSPTHEVVEAVVGALHNRVAMPIEVAHWLSAQARSGRQLSLTSQEVGWLRLLAHGARTQDVADDAGYSSRHMSRLLRTLFSRMGANNRSEAIAIASRQGHLDKGNDSTD